MSKSNIKVMKVGSCTCPAKSDGNDNKVVITIETCSRKTCPATKKDENGDDVDDGDSKKPPPRLFKLPVVCDRYHGPGCAMEISVLEKHNDRCIYKKADSEGRNPEDDKVGQYDVVGRMVFRTCNAEEMRLVQPPIGDHEGPRQNTGTGGISKADENSRQPLAQKRESIQSQTDDWKPFENRVRTQASQTGSFHSAVSEVETPRQQRADVEANPYGYSSRRPVTAHPAMVEHEKRFLKDKLAPPQYPIFTTRTSNERVLHGRDEILRMAGESRRQFPQPYPHHEGQFQGMSEVPSYSYRKKVNSDDTIASLNSYEQPPHHHPSGKNQQKFFSMFRTKVKEDEAATKPPKRNKKPVESKKKRK